MPSTLIKRQLDKKPTDSKSAHWSKKQKYDAVVLYKSVGNLMAVGRTLGIPYVTLKSWKDTDWWRDISNDIASEMRTKRSRRLDKLIDLATDLIEDNLQNGDWVFTNGKLLRRPVNALTAAKVLSTAFDKQTVLEKLAQEEKQVETQMKTEERLATLFKEFQRFSKAKDVSPEQVEGGDPNLIEGQANAIHDEREEGLQEGTQLGEHQEEVQIEGP